jgi:peptidoglycan/LPS O-acetylase OafA/YrhL
MRHPYRLNTRSERRTRLGVLVVVLIVVAAIVAPVAIAHRGGTASTSSYPARYVQSPGAGSYSGSSLRPDDRSGVRGNTLLSEPVIVSATNGASGSVAFQWGDAGIGGTIAVAAMLLAGGIVLVTRRYKTAASVT